MRKRYLTPKEAVVEGFFGSEQSAANLRWKAAGPKYSKPGNGRVVYAIEDLLAWVRAYEILTVDQRPHKHSDSHA